MSTWTAHFYKSQLSLNTDIKELEDIIGKDACEELMHAETKTEKQALEKCFSSLMNCPDEDVASSLKQYRQHMLSFGRTCFHLYF